MIRTNALAATILVASTAAAIEENDGWPLRPDGGGSSPVVLDFDRNGVLDVVVGTYDIGDPWLYAWDANAIPLDGWPKQLRFSVGADAMGVVDVDNDGVQEVLFYTQSSHGDSTYVHLMRVDGTQPEGWPRLVWRQGGSATPVAFDLDGDGTLEVLLPTMISNRRGGIFRVFRSNGMDAPGSPLDIGQSLKSSPAVGDLDLDGDMEILFGAYGRAGSGDGWVYGYHHDGTPIIEGDGIFATTNDEVTAAPISLIDISGDRRPEVLTNDMGGQTYIWTAGGNLIPNWPSPSLAESEGMAIPHIFVDGKPTRLLLSTRGGHVVVRDALSAEILEPWPWGCSWQIQSQALMGDLDGDPEGEFFIGGCAPYNWALTQQATAVDGWPVYTDANDFGSGYLADLDQDGDTDIVFQGYSGHVHVYDTPGVFEMDRIVCQSVKFDDWNTGCYEKDLYREAESAERHPGWVSRPDTSAWGHAHLEPAHLIEAPRARAAVAAGESPAPELFYRTQVPEWRRYSLWVRLRRMGDRASAPDELPSTLRARIDGRSLKGGGRIAPSPGDWLWVELGSRALTSGTYELTLRVQPRVQLDRWLLTTRDRFPLLAERPHDW